jgi:hypothetical protein
MRYISLILISIIFLILGSCTKGTNDSPVPNQLFNSKASKVNEWLKAKAAAFSSKKQKQIHDLEAYLDFESMREERLDDRHQFWVIPIKKGLALVNNKDKDPVNQLVVLYTDNRIQQCWIAQYTGSGPLPKDAFVRMSNSDINGLEGTFRFLTVTDKYLYEMNFKDGKKNTVSYMKRGTGAASSAAQTSSSTVTCTDWYIVTTYYVNGQPVHQDEVYIGTTCVGGCTPNDPNLASLDCYDNPSEGGGSGGSEDCSQEESLFDTDVISIPSVTSVETSNNGEVRSKIHTWEVVRNPFGMWRAYSVEKAVHEYVNGEWRYKSLDHISEHWDGVVIGSVFTIQLNYAVPTVGIYHSLMAVSLNLQWATNCRGTTIYTNVSRSSTATFNVNT